MKVDGHQFNAARNTVNVTMGNNWLRGDLNTIKLHVATTHDGIERGIVNIAVGFAPIKPAEFVILSIKQLAGQQGFC